MNTADSEEMARPLESRGFLPTRELEQADLVLMNTCTVRDQAEHRAQSNLGRLREWKKRDPHRILIVAGCAASRWGESIRKRYPFIDLVSPATRIEQFPEAVTRVLQERWNWSAETEETFERTGEAGGRRNGEPGNRGTGESGNQKNPETPRSLFADSPILRFPHSSLFGDDETAYITIMRGCNYRCSYCIVPQVRGREMYRPMPEILAEIQSKVAKGSKEVMLLGQTVNSYYWKQAQEPLVDFAALLREVDAVEGLERIRFMSPHPRHMRDTVIDAMAASAKVCRHLHLPVQSGSDRLLARMKRLYTRETYQSIVHKLRSRMPGILITTDFIVGFPGETEEDFEQTLSLMREVGFNGLFAFKYSPRPDTAAAALEDDVPNPLKEQRLQRVLALNREVKETPWPS